MRYRYSSERTLPLLRRDMMQVRTKPVVSGRFSCTVTAAKTGVKFTVKPKIIFSEHRTVARVKATSCSRTVIMKHLCVHLPPGGIAVAAGVPPNIYVLYSFAISKEFKIYGIEIRDLCTNVIPIDKAVQLITTGYSPVR